MTAWLFLIICMLIGGSFLCHPALVSRRYSTLMGFVFLALGFTSPLGLMPTRLMLSVGAGPDAFIGIWNLWWTRIALTSGLNPLETDLLYPPGGTSLALHTYSLTYGIASIPLQYLLQGISNLTGAENLGGVSGLCLVYNFLLISSFSLSAYFTYRLALLISGNRNGSLLAAVIFAFVNFRFANVVRLHVIATEFLVLSTWAWYAWLQRPGGKQLAAWCGALVLLLYASLEYTAYAVIVHLVCLTALRGRFWIGIKAMCRSLISIPGGFSLLALGILVAPLLCALLNRLAEGSVLFDPALARYFSADLIDFLLPNPLHPLWGGWSAEITKAYHLDHGEFGLSLGWPALALFIISAFCLFREKSGRIWLGAFFLFIFLALGPELQISGRRFPSLIMPQQIIVQVLPWLAGSRTPIRYLVPAVMFLSITIASGWAVFTRFCFWQEIRFNHLIELGVALLLILAMIPAPWNIVSPSLNPVYDEITRISASTSNHHDALIHLPGLSERQELLCQTVHGCKLLTDVDHAMPLHSIRGVSPPYALPHWKILTQQFSSPELLAKLDLGTRESLITGLKGFLKHFDVRWIILTKTRFTLSEKGDSFATEEVMTQEQFSAWCIHLRLLDPVNEVSRDGTVLFEFR